MTQASRQVLDVAGGAWLASLNHYGTGGNCMVTTLQIDKHVFVVGQDDFNIARYTLAEWLGQADQDPEPPLIECNTADEAWEALQIIRADHLLWQCGACDAWIYTSNRPRVGILRCSTCGDGGVDFHHADRHVGGE